MFPDTIILAAGASRRMGAWKPALPWGDKNLLETIVDTVMEAGSKPIVVGGRYFTEMVDMLRPYAAVRTVFAEKWAIGMLESLKAGIPFVSSESFFIVPCDMPFLKASDFLRLAEAYRGKSCRPVVKGQPGHPVLMSADHVGKIMSSPNPKLPIRALLGVSAFTEIEWDHRGVIQDMDTKEEYQAGLKTAPDGNRTHVFSLEG